MLSSIHCITSSFIHPYNKMAASTIRTWPTFECTKCYASLRNAFSNQLCVECGGVTERMEEEEEEDGIPVYAVLINYGSNPEDYKDEAWTDLLCVCKTHEGATERLCSRLVEILEGELTADRDIGHEEANHHLDREDDLFEEDEENGEARVRAKYEEDLETLKACVSALSVDSGEITAEIEEQTLYD